MDFSPMEATQEATVLPKLKFLQKSSGRLSQTLIGPNRCRGRVHLPSLQSRQRVVCKMLSIVFVPLKHHFQFLVRIVTPRGTSPRSRIPTPRVSSASNRSLISYSEEDVDGVEEPDEDLHEMVLKPAFGSFQEIFIHNLSHFRDVS